MGRRLPPPTCWSLCPALTGQAPMAQAQAETGARGPMDGRMPSSGCLPVYPQTPYGMPYRGALWPCWLCSWRGRSTSSHPGQQDLAKRGTALGAVPWTVSSHLPCGIRAPHFGDTSSPALMAQLPGILVAGNPGRARKDRPLSLRTSLHTALGGHLVFRVPLRKIPVILASCPPVVASDPGQSQPSLSPLEKSRNKINQRLSPLRRL